MIDKITLNDGNKIPQLGFGTYKAAEQEGIDSVNLHFKTVIDCWIQLLSMEMKWR